MPTQEMSEKLLKSLATEGRVVVTMVWSRAARNNVTVMPRKTRKRRIGVNGVLGPKSCGACCPCGGEGGEAASRSLSWGCGRVAATASLGDVFSESTGTTGS